MLPQNGYEENLVATSSFPTRVRNLIFQRPLEDLFMSHWPELCPLFNQSWAKEKENNQLWVNQGPSLEWGSPFLQNLGYEMKG